MRQIESNKDVLAVTRSASFNLSYFVLFYSILSHKENILASFYHFVISFHFPSDDLCLLARSLKIKTSLLFRPPDIGPKHL